MKKLQNAVTIEMNRTKARSKLLLQLFKKVYKQAEEKSELSTKCRQLKLEPNDRKMKEADLCCHEGNQSTIGIK